MIVDCSNVRFRVITSAVEVIDLTTAGKRGKACRSFSAYDLDYKDRANRFHNVVIPGAQAAADDGATFDQVVAGLEAAARELDVPVQQRERAGIDVAPRGHQDTVIQNAAFTLSVEFGDFCGRDLQDRNNLPTILPPMRARATALRLLKKLVADPAAVKRIQALRSFDELLTELRNHGIRYHYYCAMD